jgi:Rps23 Pro-64 3,4-dihydroxylase Tpa1-like proline 4-hydroxylase
MSTSLNFKESLLPLEKMKSLLPKAKKDYLQADPFPHICFDNFLNENITERILEEFPDENDIDWIKYFDGNQKKLANENEQNIGLFSRHVLYSLNSSSFLKFLEELTGITNLISDPSFRGGGLHNIYRGGKLGVHADFNKHERYGFDRRLNLLLYLNKEWCDEYGGHIELWDREMKQCVRSYLPKFNRIIIFTTTETSFHGHPEPLNCPEHMNRKSIALYYYTNGRLNEEQDMHHSTVFKLRPNEKVEGKLTLKTKKFLRQWSRLFDK